MIKKLIVSLCLGLSLIAGLTSDIIYAAESSEEEFVSIEVDLNDIEIGDSIIVYENEETNEKFVIDILPTKMTRDYVGTGNWSGGTIPNYIVTMYPHYEVPEYIYKDIGFYVTYDGKNKKILETYGETVVCARGSIEDVSSRIISAKPTSSVPAKAQMNWLHNSYTYEGDIDVSQTCYLRMEINSNNQMRLVWRIND